MQLLTFSYHGLPRLGTKLPQGGILDLNRAEPSLPANMIEFLNLGESGMALAKNALASANQDCILPEADVIWLAPLPRPGKIIGLGNNYYGHMGIGRETPPEYPILFAKLANTVIGPGQAIVIPPVTKQVDYEAELAVIIGKQARHVAQERALEFVAGYTIFNDVSARDYQKRSSQWMIGKSFDTFGPMGPVLVTADEIPDPHDLEITLTLNGMEMQHSNTRLMIFSIPYLLAYLSQVMTLEAGDVIASGTPAKTELARSVAPFIGPGDEIRISITKIGELVNPVVSG